MFDLVNPAVSRASSEKHRSVVCILVTLLLKMLELCRWSGVEPSLPPVLVACSLLRAPDEPVPELLPVRKGLLPAETRGRGSRLWSLQAPVLSCPASAQAQPDWLCLSHPWLQLDMNSGFFP